MNSRRMLWLYLPLGLYLLFALFPVYWMLVTSLKPEAEFYTLKNFLWTDHPTLANFKGLFRETHFIKWFTNSLIVALASTLISLIISSLGAYAIARLRFRGAVTLGSAILLIYLVPRTLLFIPLYNVLNRLGLINTIYALIVAYPTFTVPFCTWMLIGYFKSIPKAIEECALIDGCGRFQILSKIVFPLAAPGIVAAGIFSMTLSWSEFLYGLIFVTSSNRMVLPVGLASLEIGDVANWSQIMGGCMLASLPLLILYILLQRYFVEGLTAGAVKG